MFFSCVNYLKSAFLKSEGRGTKRNHRETTKGLAIILKESIKWGDSMKSTEL